MGAIAKVIVDIATGREFDYRVPERLREVVRVGSRVRVPFGPRAVQGHVVGFTGQSSYPKIKEITDVIGPRPLLDPPLIELARWMARYYCCPVESAMRCVLPEVVRRGETSFKQNLHVRLRDGVEDAAMPGPRAAKQKFVVEILKANESGLFLAELLRKASVTAAVVEALKRKGLVEIGARTVERDPFRDDVFVPSEPLPLSAAQQAALDLVKKSMETLTPSVVLIHGVTGSGKTEVYLQAIERALAAGKGAIVLVPEIALTPQTVERFKSRFAHKKFGTEVAVLHSNLSSGERHDEWHKIRDGRARIVIGPRSAVFAPVNPLGLIVVDEEQETSYKQEDAPRYHARDVAVVRGKLEKCAVVLGSATPALETFYNTQPVADGRAPKYGLAVLPERIDHKTMPRIRVVDLREEAHKKKAISVFSAKLRDAIAARLEKHEQVMLFLNRRGYSTSVICPICGFVAKCGNCSVSLVHHRRENVLKCHYCGHREPPPDRCPNPACRAPDIKFSGVGTEKIESAVTKNFPKAAVARMDSDVMVRKELYKEILGDFRTGKIDVLVGTQMIARGLHYPNVTLVGIIWADMGLHMPDFRAAERTFQLIVQVAGRAGRGEVEGEVVVQTFTPFADAIRYARQHDFAGFYQHEMEFRRQFDYPPFTRAVALLFRGRNEEKVRRNAEALGEQLRAQVEKYAHVAGPAPAPMARIQGFFRYQMLLRTTQIMKLTEAVTRAVAAAKLPDDVSVAVDVDPVFLM